MKRVALVVVAALLNAVAFGVTGSASELQTSPQDREAARRQTLVAFAKNLPAGAAIRVDKLDGTSIEAQWDRVNDDGDLEMVQVFKKFPYRTTVIIPVANVKNITVLRGRSLNSYSKKSGIGLGVLTAAAAGALLLGACAALSNIGR